MAGPPVTMPTVNLLLPTTKTAAIDALVQLASAMTTALAELRAAPPDGTVEIPICLTLRCNGGGDG